jgi:hypothetical protein
MLHYNKYGCYFGHCPLSSGFTNTPCQKPDLFLESSVTETLHLGLSNGSSYKNWLLALRSGDQILLGSRFSTPVQTSAEARPASCTQWLPGLFPGGTAVGSWLLKPTPISIEDRERVELYLYSVPGISWLILGCNLPLPLPNWSSSLGNFLVTPVRVEYKMHKVSLVYIVFQVLWFTPVSIITSVLTW